MPVSLSSVVENVLKYSPKAIILIISNPMDTMTYLALKKAVFRRTRFSVWAAHWIRPASNAT